jgi:NADH-quinone oxidoreductase subunit L
MNMFSLLWLVPAFPFAGFVILALFGARMQRKTAAIIGAGSVGLSAATTLMLGCRFLGAPPDASVATLPLWTWIDVAGFTPRFALYLDPLSMVMTFVVTFVGFLIHVYSIEYMRDDPAFSRFFAYMNLFVAAMLTLVLADNLVLLYLGWEGVGLCSFLLIGFWHANRANGGAAAKAFIVTRVGDTAMALGMFMLFHRFGTLDIQKVLQLAPQQWLVGTGAPLLAALLLLGGAVGKSGQLPLQVWLPDAMAGPTPVSALIHAATMVTAGVYLIARMHVIFELAPLAMTIVGIVGAATLLLAGCAAMTQRDIKRVLAYSTISQIGYMFLALGVGAWSAAIFHLVTHAFFKALLFMSAGAVILALHHEQDMFKMGGLRKKLPVVFWTFLVGAMSLAALPLVTSGFYSKDMILYEAWSSGSGGPLFWAAGWIGAILTGLYTTRMVILTFFGEAKTEPGHGPGILAAFPLITLAVLSSIAGFIELPRTLGHFPAFSHFIQTAFAQAERHEGSVVVEALLQLVAVAGVFTGVGVGYMLFVKRPEILRDILAKPWAQKLHAFWFSGWGFDAVYDAAFVRPYKLLSEWNKDDFIDDFHNGLARLCVSAHRALSASQTGRLRWCMTGIAAGAVLALAIVVFL